MSFHDSSVGKESACKARDPGSIPGSGRSAGEGTGYPLQYSGLENCMDWIVHGILQARILEWVTFPFSRGSSQPRDRTQVSPITGGFLPAEPQGKPKNTGVGSLSLLQRIFLTQESNQGLLHCRQILFQLSYQGSQSHNTVLRQGEKHVKVAQSCPTLCDPEFSRSEYWSG